MNNKNNTIAIIISLVALCISIISLVIPSYKSKNMTNDYQYVIYIGTNDQNTNEPVCTPEEAKEKIENTLTKYFGGYTIQEAHGGWEENGTFYREYSVVAYISDTDLETIHHAADDLLKEFNQFCFLIQRNETYSEFYYGKQ